MCKRILTKLPPAAQLLNAEQSDTLRKRLVERVESGALFHLLDRYQKVLSDRGRAKLSYTQQPAFSIRQTNHGANPGLVVSRRDKNDLLFEAVQTQCEFSYEVWTVHLYRGFEEAMEDDLLLLNGDYRKAAEERTAAMFDDVSAAFGLETGLVLTDEGLQSRVPIYLTTASGDESDPYASDDYDPFADR